MISLAMSRGGRGVGMGRKVMEFCGSIVRALRHDVSSASWMLPTAAAASARCGVRTLSMTYFALNTSAGIPVADHQDSFRFAARFCTTSSAVFRNFHG
jgi:hypothetical protein